MVKPASSPKNLHKAATQLTASSRLIQAENVKAFLNLLNVKDQLGVRKPKSDSTQDFTLSLVMSCYLQLQHVILLFKFRFG